MKQQELIHIHALLFEISEYIKREDSMTADPLVRYEAQSTRPFHVHRGKDAHTTAINHLLGGCAQLVQSSQQQTQTANTEKTPS